MNVQITFESHVEDSRLVIAPAALATLTKLLARPTLSQLIGEAMLTGNRVAAEPVAPAREAAPALLSAEELGAQLGLTKFKVMAMARTGEIPRTMAGRYPRFDLAAVKTALNGSAPI